MHITLQSHVTYNVGFNQSAIEHSKFPCDGKSAFAQAFCMISIFNGGELEGSHKCSLIIYTIDQIISDIYEHTITMNATDSRLLLHSK